MVTAVVQTTRIFTSEVTCDGLTVTAQLYFYSSERSTPPAATSSQSPSVLDDLRDQCAR